MKKSTLLRTSASIMATGIMLAAGIARAQSAPAEEIVVSGNNATGTLVLSGQSRTVGVEDKQTIYSDFVTTGGAGSGGGAALGGAFFVDQGATLTLNNVSFKNNVVKGGEGGSIAKVVLNDLIVNISTLKVDATPVSVVGSTPILSFDVNGDPFITGVTMSASNSLLTSGANVSFGGGITGAIGTVDGSSVTFKAPVSVASAAKALTLNQWAYDYQDVNNDTQYTNPAAGTTKLYVNANYTGSTLRPGMAVYGTGIAAGTTIKELVYDASGNVNAVVLSEATTGTIDIFNSNVNFVSVSDFDVSRYTVVSGVSNQIKPVGALPGLQVGMVVSGDGIPDGTTITNIDGNGVVTFSQAVALTGGAFNATTVAGTVGSSQLRLTAPRSDLKVGMTISGTGIPAGTKIGTISGDGTTLTLVDGSNNPIAVTKATIDAINANTFVASFGKIIGSTASSLTLASADGLADGALVSGPGVPVNSVIQTITSNANGTFTVTYVRDDNAAELQTGGSMNGISTFINTALDGVDGRNGSMYNAILHDGEGSPGTNGYNAKDGTTGAGGNGGNGGNGSSGLPFNTDAIMAVSGATLGAISDTAGLAADWADFGFARAAVDTLKVAQAWIDVGIATADLIKWRIDLADGIVGFGGDGGSGGEGGKGATFFGGGAGGDGGNGGEGALSYTDGGAGGDGGTGGAGGFGAGGGSGGAGGEGGTTGAAADGGAGDGGTAGFGGGSGSNGDGLYGGGGSGYGGAIFVRSGGKLTIKGDSLFQNNTTLGGSSNNGGEAGQAAGTDLFIMRGTNGFATNVTLMPGLGNTIRFEGSIADDSAASIDGAAWASGNGASIQITGGGLVQFAGENTYSGATYIGGATLESDLGTEEAGAGIHNDSTLVFNGTSTIGSSLSNETAGVLLTSGTIVRKVGTVLPGQVKWTGSGGFAATDAGLTLDFGTISDTQSQVLTWNAGGFVVRDGTLLFGSEYGTGAVKLVNSVNLNGERGRIAVYDNATVATDYAQLAGVFSNGTLEVGTTGYMGQAYFTGLNTLSGLILNAGTVSTQLTDANDNTLTGRLMHATNGGSLQVNAGYADLYSKEKLTTLNIAAAGAVTANAGFTATSAITNAGVLDSLGETSTAAITNTGLIRFREATTTGSIFNDDNGQTDPAKKSILVFNKTLGVTGDVVNQSLMTVEGAATVSGFVQNTGTLALLDGLTSGTVINSGFMDAYGTSSLGAVYNTGTLGLFGTVDATSLVNDLTGEVNLSGSLDLDSIALFGVDGKVYLAGNLTAGDSVTNNGLLTVVGDISQVARSLVEKAATRTITTTGFAGGIDGVVELGGYAGITNKLVINQSDNSTYHGIFQGAGSLEKTGIGTLTLTGANTFTGGLTITKGGINTTGGGTFADTLDVTVATAGTYTIGTEDRVRSITNAGTVSATANVIVDTLTNTGTATFGADFGAFANVSNAKNARLTFGGSAAVIKGSLTNAGTLLANAVTTVQGALVQNGGTLTAGANLTTGSLSGTGGTIAIGNNIFTVNQSENGTYAGAITGAGDVVKRGTATLTLAGAVGSFAPAKLWIQQGTVAVDGADILSTALSVDVAKVASLSLVKGDQTIRNLTGTGTLALNGNNLYLEDGGKFAGTVTGIGNVQVASGQFELSNTINSTSGTFEVKPDSQMLVTATGTLNAPVINVTGTNSRLDVVGIVNSTTNNVTGILHLGDAFGTVAGTVVSQNTTVNGGGLLSGVGTVRNTVIVGGRSVGTLRPGNSPGTITFDDLTLDNLAVTQMEIEGNAGAGLSRLDGGYDRITVNSKLKIQSGSKLELLNSTDFELALGEKIQILKYAPGAVSGQFSTVTSQFARGLALNLATGSVVGLGARTPAAFETAVANTANEKAMLNGVRVGTAGGVNQYYGGRLVEYAAGALATGNAANVTAAFDKASPEAYLGLMDHMKLSMLDNRVELGGYDLVDQPAYYVTGAFQIGKMKSEDRAGYEQFRSNDRRASIGVAAHYPFARFQIGYGYTDGTVRSQYMNGDVTGHQFNLGASAPVALDGALRLTARFVYGDYAFKGTRLTNAGTANFGGVGGSSIVYGAGFEYLQAWDRLSVNLTGEVLGVDNKVDAFTETGVNALDSLTVHKQRDQFAMASANLKVGYQFQPWIKGYLGVAIDQDLEDRLRDVTGNVSVEALSMTVQNPGFTATRVRGTLGAKVDVAPNITWTLEGNAGNASAYGGRTAVTFRF